MNKLTLNELRRSETLSKIDRAQLVKTYVSSQQVYSDLHAKEGKNHQATWNLPTPSTPKLLSTDDINAGFDTPVLKARMPDSQPTSRTENDMDKGPSVIPASPLTRAKHRKTVASARDLDKASGGVYRARPSQKTLEECSNMVKGSKGAVKKGKKRARSEDMERDARLTERRERRRAKKAIMEPKQSSSVHSSDNQKDDKAKRRENSKKTKNKGVNVAAGLALMHGFSAQNIGSSRLTLKPSFGVFQKGKASAKTKVQKKQKAAMKQWSEETFLGRKTQSQPQPGTRTCSSSASDDGSGEDVAPVSKDSFGCKRTSINDDVKADHTPPDADVVSSDVRRPAVSTKGQRTESMVWDIELEDRKLSSPSIVISRSPKQKNSSIILDTHATQWHVGTPVDSHREPSQQFENMSSPVPDVSASSRCNTPVQADGLFGSHRPSSLAPSQSASQVIRDSPCILTSVCRPARHIHRSKYFPSPRPVKPILTRASTPEDRRQASPESIGPLHSSNTMSVSSYNEHGPSGWRYPPDIGYGHWIPDTEDSQCCDFIDYEADLGLGQLQHQDLVQIPPFYPSRSPSVVVYAAVCSSDDYNLDHTPFADLTQDDGTNMEPEESPYDEYLMSQASAEPWEEPGGTFLDHEPTHIADNAILEHHEDIVQLTGGSETDYSPRSPARQSVQSQALLPYNVYDWLASPPGYGRPRQNEYPTVSKVEEDVAKRLRGHWHPQRL